MNQELKEKIEKIMNSYAFYVRECGMLRQEPEPKIRKQFADAINQLYHDYYLSLTEKEMILSDIEMANTQGDKESCLSIIHSFGTCKGCSGQCELIAEAQLAKVLPIMEAQKEQAISKLNFIDENLEASAENQGAVMALHELVQSLRDGK